MQILSKDEIKDILGKVGMLGSKSVIGRVGYVSGIDGFDEKLDGKLFTESGAIINLIERPKGLEIQLSRLFKSYPVALLEENILSITLESKEQIYSQKEKSVIGRALVGGLILGPVGAVIGGMSGIGTKQVQEKMPDNFVTINTISENSEGAIIFTVAQKDTKEVSIFFKSLFPGKFNQVTV